MGTGDALVTASTQEDAWALRRAGARLRTELRDPARGGALVPEAVPVLIRMLRAPSGRSRRDALRLLAELAGRPAAYWWPIWDRGGRALLAPVVPEVARLAGDTDRKVRGLVPSGRPSATWRSVGCSARTGAEAAALLPVVRAAALQNAVVSAAALEVLAGWGPAAAPAVPELTGALDTAEARRAAAALGAVGPAADRAAPRLRELAEGVGVPAVTPGPRDPRALPWHGAQTAAWAYWRITGEHRLALRVLGEAVAAGPGRPHLRYLADLGPLASRHAEAVRALLDHPGDWTRVEAAHAWWRLTGEPGPAVEVLAGELASARPTDELPAVLRYLTGIGGPAAAAAPVLEAYLSGHRRELGGTPLTPRQDELLTAAAAGALAAIRTG
ncbi:hypothetical protein J5Y04_28435 [Kitasatospora sp. RG8]|uniref:hypothetical protein n=1 Tax=Kitasatospora sp. RG8 TaxID=2820815 RepID=UPI001AE0954D|nr:hypothetical protein [Kitasatospora sp. RG8]MBP0453444.1 hypothetical protein [Kitasatospora sp. RG8]